MNATIRGFKAGKPYRVIKPIPVSLRKEDGGWTASFKGCNIAIAGDTKREAVRDLRSMILICYERWSQDDPKIASLLMWRYWQKLQRYVQRKPR